MAFMETIEARSEFAGRFVFFQREVWGRGVGQLGLHSRQACRRVADWLEDWEHADGEAACMAGFSDHQLEDCGITPIGRG